MNLRVFHTTRYTYPTPARDSYNEARLMPLTDEDQACLQFRLNTTPATRVFSYNLVTGRVHHFNLRQPHQELVISAVSSVITRRTDPLAGLQLISDDSHYYQEQSIQQDYAEYLSPSKYVALAAETDHFRMLARRQSTAASASFLFALTRVLQCSLVYTKGATTVETPVEEVIQKGKGVCQDFAHVMLAACRRQGIPARYISGYLFSGAEEDDTWSTSDTPGAAPGADEEKKAGSDRPAEPVPREETGGWVRGRMGGEATHAWVECLLPEGRWCGFDPTNGVLVNDAYIKVHYGRDYGDVTPLRGLYRGPGSQDMQVSVRVVKEE